VEWTIGCLCCQCNEHLALPGEVVFPCKEILWASRACVPSTSLRTGSRSPEASCGGTIYGGRGEVRLGVRRAAFLRTWDVDYGAGGQSGHLGRGLIRRGGFGRGGG
jgi:hypothetical protein